MCILLLLLLLRIKPAKSEPTTELNYCALIGLIMSLLNNNIQVGKPRCSIYSECRTDAIHYSDVGNRQHSGLLVTLHNNKFWEELNHPLSLIQHGLHKKRSVQKFFYCYVFVAALTFLPDRCLATIRGYTKDWWEGFIKYAFEMGSGAMIYVPSLTKTGSANQKMHGGGGGHRHIAWWSHKHALIFSK
jgi:hypothetical protein